MDISREVMEQYEQIRKFGACNMLDINCVQNIADQLFFYELAGLSREEYGFILSNFSSLMKKYNIKQ